LLNVHEVARVAWERAAIEWPAYRSAIKRAAQADLADTQDTMAETLAVRGPVAAAKIAAAWSEWYGDYVARSVERIVAALDADAVAAEIARKRKDRERRLIETVCDVMLLVERSRLGMVRVANIPRSLGLSRRRVNHALAVLRMIGMVRILGPMVQVRGNTEAARKTILDRRAVLMDAEAAEDAGTPWPYGWASHRENKLNGRRRMYPYMGGSDEPTWKDGENG
jgi:DNA-binding transcriptional ArsR family regulator